MNRLRSKLRSKRGASITFALLIFLVCAMVSSVVIVAATTAGGRLSELRQSDQRYYTVTSAAELICGAFNNENDLPISVTVEYTGKGATAANFQVSDADASNSRLLCQTSEDVMQVIETGGEDITRTLQLTAGTYTSLNCAVVETVGKNGLAQFDISNVPVGTSQAMYTLRVVLSSNIQKGEPDASGKTSAKVSWKLNSIRKVVKVNESSVKP